MSSASSKISLPYVSFAFILTLYILYFIFSFSYHVLVAAFVLGYKCLHVFYQRDSICIGVG